MEPESLPESPAKRRSFCGPKSPGSARNLGGGGGAAAADFGVGTVFGLVRRHLVGLSRFKRRGAAPVWCPISCAKRRQGGRLPRAAGGPEFGDRCRNRAGFRWRYAQRRRGGQRSRHPERRDVRTPARRPDGCGIRLLCERQRRSSCGQRAAARGVGGRGGGGGAKKTRMRGLPARGAVGQPAGAGRAARARRRGAPGTAPSAADGANSGALRAPRGRGSAEKGRCPAIIRAVEDSRTTS
jgi:hypothetical protein